MQRPEAENLTSALDAMWSGSPSPPEKSKRSVTRFFTRSRKSSPGEEETPPNPPPESSKEAPEVAHTPAPFDFDHLIAGRKIASQSPWPRSASGLPHE